MFGNAWCDIVYYADIFTLNNRLLCLEFVYVTCHVFVCVSNMLARRHVEERPPHARQPKLHRFDDAVDDDVDWMFALVAFFSIKTCCRWWTIWTYVAQTRDRTNDTHLPARPVRHRESETGCQSVNWAAVAKAKVNTIHVLENATKIHLNVRLVPQRRQRPTHVVGLFSWMYILFG